MHSTVPLHPVANRRGDQSATVVAVDIDPAQQAERASAVHDATKSDSALAQAAGAASRPQLRRSPHSSGPTERQHTGTASDPEPSMVRPAADAPVWGLQHDDLSAYPIIEASPAAGLWNDAAAAGRKRATSTASAPHSYFYSGSSGMMEGDAPPLRKMSAAQFAELFARYAAVDVPHAVVFPFLHGVDGDNVSQNVFFGAPLTGMSAPRYRGLTVVRADMPAPGQRLLYHRRMRGASISSSKHSAGASFSNPRSRADSVATDTSESVQSSAHYSASSSSSDGHGAWGGGVNVPLSTTSSAHSVSSYGASLFSHRSGVGSHSLGSMTSISSSNAGEDGFFGDFQNKGGAVRFGNMQQQACRQPYEPQPGHSLLNSSVFPVELLVAPPSAASRSPKKDCNATLNTAPAALAGKRGGARARFVKPRQAQGVSLRNFKIQCAKYATISDIVLYCPAGLHEGMIELATWFRDAQDAWWEERQARGLGGLRYNVFLIEDPFETFEEHFPELISVDSAGRSANRVDFVDREREEMQRLTRASEIDTNVWLGSTGDVPMANGSSERIHLSNAFQAAEEARAANPHGFSICIEAHEAAEMPAPSRLSHAADYLDALESICNRDRALLTGESGLGDMEELETETKSRSVLSLGPRGWSPPLRKRPSKSSPQNQRGSSSSSSAMTPSLVLPPLRIAPESMVMLESPVANQHEAQDTNAQNKLAEDLIELCSWIKKQADPTAPAPQPPTTSSWMMRKSSEKEEPRSPRRVLLHCGDGYTETSVLALTYVMMSRRLCLPEAYLYLQKEMQRSFFVYARELPLLKKIEAKLQQRFPLNGSVGSGDRPKSNHGPADDVSSQHLAVADLEESVQIVEEHEASAPAPERSGWQRSLAAAASGLVSAIPNHKRHTSSSVLTSKPGGNTLSARAKTPTPASPQMSPVLQQAVRQEDKYPWFYDARFEGAFPSRILPFLYLGNLNHAMNAGMLHALGITHVVSVGESALSPADGALPPAALAPGNGDACGNSTLMRAASLWHERNAGRIGVLDLQNVSDDGIDPLRATMKQAVEYIENCRRSGGKVLVHCRVGVSRSSTIVLAYVMAHLDLSLVESYLLVRSRRLNILIQPHLLFFWELRSWETYLARQKLVRSRSNSVASREADGDILMGIAGDLDRQGSWSGAAEDNFASLSLAKKSLEHLEASQEGSSADDEIDMDLALGAGSVHGTPTCDTPLFGAGSPQGLPSISLRLTWGFLAREIAHLNERYFQ